MVHGRSPILIGTSDFIFSTTVDYRSACAAEICRCLAAMQSANNLFVKNNDSTKMQLAIASDGLGVIRKFEKETKALSMNTKFHPTFR